MTTPHDPRTHPLQDDEVELARVLRALPAGEPSAKLDAAILAAASDAVAGRAASPRRRLRPAWALPTWAIGTAAAAVLAVGIGVQLLPPPSTTADRAQVGAAPASGRVEAEDRLDVDFIEDKREIAPTYPPPPEPRRQVPHVPAQPVAPPPPPPPPAAAAPEPQAFPAPAPSPRDAGAFAPPPAAEADGRAGGRAAPESRLRQSPSELNRLDAERRARARQLEQLQAARADAERDETAAAQRAEAPLADVAEESTMREQAAGANLARDTAPVVGAVADDAAAVAEAAPPAAEASAAAPAPAAPAPPAAATGAAAAKTIFPPVADDARLYPEGWLARIRERWRGGDRDGARASLALFRERYPQHAVPADLQPLLTR